MVIIGLFLTLIIWIFFTSSINNKESSIKIDLIEKKIEIYQELKYLTIDDYPIIYKNPDVDILYLINEIHKLKGK
jgi:hypothetical protein